MVDPFDRLPGALAEPVDATNQANRDNILVLFRLFWRNKWLLAAASFVGMAIAGLYLLRQVPVYEARTSIELLGVNEDFLDMRRVDPTAGRNGGDNYIQTQIKLLQSNALKQSVVKDVQKSPVRVISAGKTPVGPPATYDERTGVLVGAPLKDIRDKLGIPSKIKISPKDALEMAADTVKIRGSGLTKIVEVYVQSTWPALAADFSNRLADQYIQQNLLARAQTAQDTTAWLSLQLDDIKVKLEQAEQRLQASAHGSQLTITEQGNLAEAKLRQIQTDQISAHADRMLKQSHFELTQNRAPDELPDVLNDPSLRDYRSKLTELRRQLADQSAAFTDEHPTVVRLKLQVQTLESARDRELKNVLSRIKTEFEGAKRREALLDEAYNLQSQLVAEQAGKSVQYNVAKREVDTIRTLYDTMLQKVREAGIAAALRRHDARVVDYAEPPEKPIKPNAPILLGMGMFGGMSFAVMFVLARERSRRAFASPGDSVNFLGVAELGIIPSAGADPAIMSRRRLFRRSGEAGDRRPLELMPWDQGPSITSESFHAALVSINFASSGGGDRRVLMVTSADPSEGKTFTTVNLAVAAAKRGDRVLLIDGDMRRPRIHDIFGVPKAPGLGAVLSSPSLPPAESINALIHQTSIRNLSLLPAGDASHDIARLLHSNVMASFIEWARDNFDMVLLDTPPMMQVSDSRIFGRYVDAVILTIRSGQTPRDKARAALRKFEQDGTVVLGTILTDWNPSRSGEGGEYYGKYTSYYHRASD